MPEISVVIITFNEEKNIRRCLESVRDFADEIVVLDSFSKDNTETICKEFGVRFFQHVFDGHIEQKNRAITHAKYAHVFSIDADEVVSPELNESIKKAKQAFQKDGYYMNRLTNYCGTWIRHSGWYPDRKLRLWDSRKGSWKGMNPHDRYEMFEGDVKTGSLKGDILHYSYYTVEEHYKQAEYFSTIAAKAYLKSGKKATILNLILNPLIKFIRNYFLKLGFLDGLPGYKVCSITAYETYMKYKKLIALQNQS